MTAETLIDAVRTLNASDGFKPRFDAHQWRAFTHALQPVTLRPGDPLIRLGDHDRTVFFVGSGNLQIFVPQEAGAAPQGRRPVTILRPGSVVGEPALFADTPRMAQVEAMSSVVAFGLTRARFQELSLRQPGVAVETLRALGAVMADRMRANLQHGAPVA